MTTQPITNQPTAAFVGASWLALLAGMFTYLSGLWNSSLALSEKGFYFILLMYGLFTAVSLQKSVRDKLSGIHVTAQYFGLCWFSMGLVILLIVVSLWNATMSNSDKGFYAMSFVLSLFAAIAVQKNTRDKDAAERSSTKAVDAPDGER